MGGSGRDDLFGAILAVDRLHLGIRWSHGHGNTSDHHIGAFVKRRGECDVDLIVQEPVAEIGWAPVSLQATAADRPVPPTFEELELAVAGAA